MKITIKSIFLSLICISIFSGCNTQKLLVNYMKQKGTVLKEYEKDDEYFMILKEANTINKYRIYNYSGGGSKGSSAEIIYSVDTLIQTCYAGKIGTNEIDCEKLKRDNDLMKYITW